MGTGKGTGGGTAAVCRRLAEPVAEELGLTAVWARGLPGKTAPVTAAAAIRDALYHILEERGEPF